MDTINSVLQILDKLQGLPAVTLVFFSCIAVGYVLRFIKAFPNDGIPVVVILWGAVAMLFIADPRANDMPERIWTSRNLFIGLSIGTIAWIAHKIALSKLEDWFGKKWGKSADDTTFFNKPDPAPSNPIDPPPPKP